MEVIFHSCVFLHVNANGRQNGGGLGMRLGTLLYPSIYIGALLFLYSIHKQILIALTLIIQVKICVVINDL